ncbi:MAG: TauD/TfdA family dioxygenase [Pseudomonadota bacterium]
MFTIRPSGETLGADILDVDLNDPLTDEEAGRLLQALAQHGVLRIPRQKLPPEAHKDFAARFGSLEVNVASGFSVDGLPEVMILSNMVADGKPVGLGDAGQDWHTDMSYSRTIALTSILFAVKVPLDDCAAPLGATEFSNMHAAYDGLPEDIKTRLDGATATHDFDKFWEMMRREKGSTRPPLTPEQRRRKPPVSHPVFLDHPVTGRKVLYANPGYAVRIDGLPPAESDDLLDFLFEHQLKPEYRYRHRWTEGDVLMWDNIGTIHNSIADYAPHQHRYMRRCQVMADKVFAEAAT